MIVYRTVRWHARGDAVAIRHTNSIAQRVQQARKVLGLAHNEFEDCTAFQKALTKLEMPFRRFNAFLENLIPDSDAKVYIMMLVYAIPLVIIVVGSISVFQAGLKSRFYYGGGGEY